MKGYKGMIKDRLIPIWNLALLWCSAKTRWLDLVYDIHIRNIDNRLKSETCKVIAGRKNKDGIQLSFMSTVSNDDCFRANNPEEYEYWESINTWVKWFARYSLYFSDDLKRLSEKKFKERWNIDTKLYKFLIKNINLL